MEAFRKAMAETKSRWGSWRVKWGDVHRLRRGDKDLPVGGGSNRLGCFRICEYDEAGDGKLVMDGGDCFVLVVAFGDVPEAYSVLSYSQSGRPDSKHYNDQLRLFAENKMKPVAVTEKDINARLIREYRPGE